MAVLWPVTGKRMHLGRKGGEKEITRTNDMEFLKLKLLDVLSHSVPLNEFEQWMYTDTRILSTLDSNDFIFDIVTLNYKKSDCLNQLFKLISKELSFEESSVISIVSSCKRIKTSENKTYIFQEISRISQDFDFDSDYNLLWTFYNFKQEIDLIDEGLTKEGDIIQRIKKSIRSIICEFESYASFPEKLKVLHYK